MVSQRRFQHTPADSGITSSQIGIHPLHRQLQRLPAPHRAHRRGGGEHFLGFDGRIGKEGVFGAGGEIGEVGHGEGSFLIIASDTFITVHHLLKPFSLQLVSVDFLRLLTTVTSFDVLFWF